MKRISKALLVVLACFVGSAAAIPSGAPAKIQRFTSPKLCYLDVAANEKDALLVHAELQRRDVACTPDLKLEGEQAIEQAARRAQLHTASASLQRERMARENQGRRETDRMANCALNRPNQSECFAAH